MTKRTHLLSNIVTLVLATVLLAACSSAPAPQPTSAPAKPAAPEPTKPAAAPAPAPTAAAAQPAAQYPKMTLKLGHVGVLDMSYHKGSLKFSDLVKERSGGNVEIQVFPNSQLGSEKDMVEQVKAGVINFALTSPTFIATYDGWGPTGVMMMPYLYKGNTDEEQYPALIKLARGPLMKEVADKAAAASGIRAMDLGWWYGSRNLTTKTKQVTKPDDLKGLKIRTMDAPLGKVALQSLGAVVTPMAVAELYSALQMGVVEGQENPFNTIYSSKYYEVQKYLATTGHMTMNVMIVTNDKWFNSLSPDVQALLKKGVEDAGDYQSDIQLKANKQNLQDLKDKGMVVTEVNKAEWADKTKDAWKDFETMFGKGFYEKVKAEVAK